MEFDKRNPFHRIKVISASPFNGPTKGVMKALAERLNNRTLDCYPSHKTISRESGFSVPTVKRVLRALEGMGLISSKPRYHPNPDRCGERISNIYKMHVDKWLGLTADSIPEKYRHLLQKL